MESWKGHNYYTRDPKKWVELMNLSTSEWNIGPLPPNVVAIPGPLNASYNFPPDTLVIENASQVAFGSRDIEKVIFGATSGLVILWAISWVGWNWWKDNLLKPRGYTPPSEETDPDHFPPMNLDGDTIATSSVMELGTMANGFIPASKFKTELDIYYEDVRTELEMYEKNLRTDGVDPEDVEASTELLRRMYETQLRLYSVQNSPEVSQRERDQMAAESEALLADFRALVVSWSGKQNVVGWGVEELEELSELVALLKAIPENRYR